jgi:hypothetical protein
MLTVRIQRTMGLERDSQGRPIQYMEIDVSTAEELPASGVIDGVKVGHGSIARVVQTGAFWSWDEETATWYDQNAEG